MHSRPTRCALRLMSAVADSSLRFGAYAACKSVRLISTSRKAGAAAALHSAVHEPHSLVNPSEPVRPTPPRIAAATRVSEAGAVKIVLESGSVLRFHNVWLRDHCLCPHCRDPTTRQRLLDSVRIPPRLAVFDIGVEESGRELRLEWEAHDVNHDGWAAPREGDPRIPDVSHVSRFPLDWLIRHAYWVDSSTGTGQASAVLPTPDARTVDPAQDTRGRVLWGRAHFGSTAAPLHERSFPTARFTELMSIGPGGVGDSGYSAAADAHLGRALTAVRDYGVLLVEGVPCSAMDGSGDEAVSEAASEAASEALWRRLGSGRLQSSVYGPGAWRTEVRPPASDSFTDTAYGRTALPSHMDGSYMAVPPGLQAFHAIRADPSGGGATVLVDGFAAAERLRAADPAAFAFLATFEVPFAHLGTDGLQLRWARIIELDDAGGIAGLCWSISDRAPLTLRRYAGLRAAPAAASMVLPTSAPSLRQAQPEALAAAAALSLPSAVPAFYAATRALAAQLRDPAAEVSLVLRPGTALILDNRRVTHARTALGRGPESARRVLAGGYVATEDWHSTLRLVCRAAGSYEPA